MNRILIAASAAAFATLATAATSHAATAAVRTADLDLASAEGQARLDSRINRALRSVCSYDITGSRIVVVDKDCVTKTRASVEQQVAARRVPSRSGG